MAEFIDIEKAANEPLSGTQDGTTVRRHSLRELIEAKRFEQEQQAGKSKKLSIRLAKIRPGGAI